MSIKGIDTQIMITRSPDFARDASTMQKRPEIMQEFLAAQQKINDAQDHFKVAKTTESDMEKIRTDVDGGSGGAHGDEGQESGDGDKEDESGAGMLVPPGNNVIDITI